MQTPNDTATQTDMEIIREFERVLSSKLPGGLGAPLTRAETALLLTFSRWQAQRAPRCAPAPSPPPARTDARE